MTKIHTAVREERTRKPKPCATPPQTPDALTTALPRPPRRSNPVPLQFSSVESAILVLKRKGFWEAAAELPRNEDLLGMRGRKPGAPDYVKFLLTCLRSKHISMIATITQLSFPPTWAMIRDALNAHRPEGFLPCPDTCPNESQMKTFNQRMRDVPDFDLEELCEKAFKLEASEALALGLLDPNERLSWRHPNPQLFIAMDGTCMKPAFGRGPDDSVGPQIVFNDEKAKNKPFGSKFVSTSIHTGIPGGRLILRTDIVPPGPQGSPGGESPFVQGAVHAVQEYTNGGVKGVIVDSVVRGKHVAELAREGIVVVNYPYAKSNPNRAWGGRKAPGREERTVEIRTVSHKVAGRKKLCEHAFIVSGSNPKTRAFDESGNEQLVDLKIINGYPRSNGDGSMRHYHDCEMPCPYGNFIVRQQLYPVDDTTINYGEHFRYFPTDSEQFAFLYGRRNDTESLHRQYKRVDDRMPVKGMKLQKLYLVGMMITHNAEALERIRRATEAQAPPGLPPAA